MTQKIKKKKYCSLKKYINIILELPEEKKHRSAVDFGMYWKNFSGKILNYFNSVKNILKECLTLNFIPIELQ